MSKREINEKDGNKGVSEMDRKRWEDLGSQPVYNFDSRKRKRGDYRGKGRGWPNTDQKEYASLLSFLLSYDCNFFPSVQVFVVLLCLIIRTHRVLLRETQQHPKLMLDLTYKLMPSKEAKRIEYEEWTTCVWYSHNLTIYLLTGEKKVTGHQTGHWARITFRTRAKNPSKEKLILMHPSTEQREGRNKEIEKSLFQAKAFMIEIILTGRRKEEKNKRE